MSRRGDPDAVGSADEQCLEALNALARGLGHALNNPLAAALLAADELKERNDDEAVDALREALEEMTTVMRGLRHVVEVENRKRNLRESIMAILTQPHAQHAKVSSPKSLMKRSSGVRRKVRRILVVDDERLVARAIVRVVDAREAVVVHSGRAALDALREGASFDAMVCDFMLPDMDGRELFEAVSAQRPDLARHTVFVTGGTTLAEAVAFLDSVPNPVVAKPFRPDELREALSSVLESVDRSATGT